MATRKSGERSSPAPSFRKYPPRPPAGPPEIVDPAWLVKAVGLTIGAALICGYASLCLLLYQGQWQLVLHPRQTTSHPAALDNTPIEFVRFGPDESGRPQRTAWAISSPHGRYSAETVLFLPPGDGSLADSLPVLTMLHSLGIGIVAIDYQGYGESNPLHPNQERMAADAAAAWQYLTQSRGVPEKHIVLYGAGVGASLATALAASHPAVPALVLDSPTPDPLTTVRRDPRTRFLPVRLLLHDRFPLAEPLAALKTPKLLLSSTAGEPAFVAAASPKLTVELPNPRSETFYAESVRRFLDLYLGQSRDLPAASPRLP